VTPPPQRRGAPADKRKRRAATGYRPPAVDAPRQVAYDVLSAVRERDAYANLVLPGMLRDRRLDTRDAALATELAYGTLRGRGLYDAVLQACVDRPLTQVDPPVLDVLRLGAHQLLRTRIPTHAAVSATVDLARRVLSAGPVGLRQRRAAQGRRARPRRLAGRAAPGRPAGGDGARAQPPALDRLGLPRRAARRPRRDRGGPAGRRPAPEVHLVARRMPRDELLELTGGQAGPWSAHAVRLREGDPGGFAPVRDGRAGVQDEGSQLVALALAGAPLDGPDALWVDLCSGPGGKAALLDTLARERGARLLALEVQPHRAALVRGSGVPLVATADSRRPPLRPGSVDRILLDAPCSGLGALRRRPEARWRRQPSDLPGLTRLQGELLDAAVALLRPGGVAVYATCSPHLAETVVPVSDVLRRHPELEQVDVRPQLPGVPELGDGPAVQLWPHLHGTDAMYLTLLRRRSLR
jgi:16S rRNA (cytosine967-C5)-methyltransferase